MPNNGLGQGRGKRAKGLNGGRLKGAKLGASKKLGVNGNDAPEPLQISPQNPSVAVGQPLQLTAQNPDGSAADVFWESSDPTTAAIDDAGNITALKAGSVAITAIGNGEWAGGGVVLTVTPSLASIAITPANPSVGIAQPPLQLTATATYSDNSTRDVTTSVTWGVSSSGTGSGAATVSAGGLVTGTAAGPVTITATLGTIVQNASLTVTPALVSVTGITISAPFSWIGAGQKLQLTATATYSNGNTSPLTSNVTWGSSSAAGSTAPATVSSTGLVTGANCGLATVTASYPNPSNPNAPFTYSLQLNVVPNFADLATADLQAFMNAKSRVNQLLTAFERRGNLADAEIASLNDGLELVTEYINNNPSTPVPNFNAASKAGNNVSDLGLLGISWNSTAAPGPGSAVGTGSGKANVIDDTFRAIGDYLYGPPPLAANGVSLEHDPGTFPYLIGTVNPPGLTYDQMRMAAVYGYAENQSASAPPYRTNPALITPDDNNRRNLFNQTVEAADADFRTNGPLYAAALARLIGVSQTAQINVSDWAKVVSVLVSQGITANNPQLNTWIDRALDTAQNVGQSAPPSQISISLPDLEQSVSNFEIIPDNIFALQPAYFCSMLEELKVFQVVEKLVELFQNGVLPVLKGDAGNYLFAWWKNAALRISESERRGFYARALGFPGGDADSPNRDFKDLFMRFVSAVSSFVRQNTVDNLLRSNIPSAISQQQVRKSARDLATNISSHGYGIAYPMATELQKELNDVMAILMNGEIQGAYGAKDMWQLVDQVAALELGGNKNSVKYRTMASAGAVVFAWLANHAQLLAANAYVPVLDITQLQLPPSYSTAPTTNPSDFDLTGACDQWLAVTGTQEDTVEQQAQPVEAPVIPSRPIQIPSVARDMLDSVGIPAMSYAAGFGNGKANVKVPNWRTH